VRANIARLEAAGARVEYVPCDVRDPDAFGAVIDGVYARHGRLDGVVHGAGIIEDRLVRDKAPDSLERVVATKAGSALTLAERLRPTSLRFCVLFGSVSGRFGNRGQADYAAASEVLNKLAQDLDRRWPARVVAMNWGPWRAAGMVSPELEREFARHGVVLIPVRQGRRLMLDELERGRTGDVEVTIGAAAAIDGGDPHPAPATDRLPLLAANARVARGPAGGLEVVRTLAVGTDRYLDDHRLDGRPVLPFAVAMEHMAEAAAAVWPGATVAGLRDIRVTKGVIVDEPEGTPIAVVAAPRAAAGEIDAEIRSGSGERVHFRSVVALRDARSQAAGAGAGPPALDDLPPFGMAVADAYRDLLFHGPLFQGIEAVEGLDERGLRARLRPSDPGRCVAGAAGRDWLLDPILIDCALQLQVVWARLTWGVTLLPAEIGAYRRYAPPPRAGGGPVRLELRIRPDSAAPLCRTDHWFLGADGTVLARMTDVVGVGSERLNRLAAGAA
jgi:NAD(P)-dependent dehydrogenase (short-subunit alcohol dehydrogenase family)